VGEGIKNAEVLSSRRFKTWRFAQRQLFGDTVRR
jgi:hypothetical protein